VAAAAAERVNGAIEIAGILQRKVGILMSPCVLMHRPAEFMLSFSTHTAISHSTSVHTALVFLSPTAAAGLDLAKASSPEIKVQNVTKNHTYLDIQDIYIYICIYIYIYIKIYI
jgi:hypothetical protein